MKAPHGWVDKEEQLPAPLHERASVAIPLVQEAAPQLVSAPWYAHDALWPLQVPAQIPEPAQGVWLGAGAPVTLLHVPGLVGRAHDWHEPVQGESQHTLSTQLPKAQSEDVTQAAPRGAPAGRVSTTTAVPSIPASPATGTSLPMGRSTGRSVGRSGDATSGLATSNPPGASGSATSTEIWLSASAPVSIPAALSTVPMVSTPTRSADPLSIATDKSAPAPTSNEPST
jgi:hypothetical protein